MDFTKILDMQCQCLQAALENCFEDLSGTFSRRINDKRARIRDFQSQWDRNRRLINHEPVGDDDCEGIMALKGISVNRFADDTREEILKKYARTFMFSPKSGRTFILFQFRDGAGRIRSTPQPDDLSHHDFYKSDAFSLEHIEILDTGEIPHASDI